VKNFARLVLFNITFFVCVFVLSAAVSFLQFWVSAASAIPVVQYIYLETIINHAQWMLSFSFYITVLFTLNYAQRNRVLPLAAFITVALLSGGLPFAAALGLSNARNMNAPPYAMNTKTLGNAGVMMKHGQTTITLIDKPELETGSRVIAAPERALYYQDVPLDEDGKVIPLPHVNFYETNSFVYQGLRSDFSFSSREFSRRYESGIFSFLVWLCPLILFLMALSYMFNVGAWPLANLFLCAVIFRAVLLFEVFLNKPAIQDYLAEFTRNLIPRIFITPAVFLTLAALALLYDILMYFARERGRLGNV
jgi:hypothetical protein